MYGAGKIYFIIIGKLSAKSEWTSNCGSKIFAP
jgi:hypothetical protein